jgi:predicted PurR-regulated permease PerM
VGLLVLVIAIPSAFLAMQGTSHVRQILRCGDDMQKLAYAEISPMTAEQLSACISYFPENQASDAVTLPVQDQLANGISLKEQAASYLLRHGSSFQRETVMARYSIYYFMEFILAIILLFAVFIVIWPLWDIHISMVEDKQKKEHETNSRLGNLYDELTSLIKQDNLDEADKIKTKIKFLSNELVEIQKYPRWPISSLPVIRTYLSSSLISAFLTYALSLFNVTMSTELGSVVKELITSVFGGK